jgi:hypothetical protein
MSVELTSIATKALDKKGGKKSVLGALMKAGMDDKTFEEKLKLAVDKNSKDSKAILLNLKNSLPQANNTQKHQKNSTTNEDSSTESLIHRQIMTLTHLTSELQTEKSVKDLRDSANSKDSKKLSTLLDKLHKDGIKGNIKVETVDDSETKAELDKIKKHDDSKSANNAKAQKALQDSKAEQDAKALRDSKSAEDIKALQDAKAQRDSDAKKSVDDDSQRAKLEKNKKDTKAQENVSDVKKDTKPAQSESIAKTPQQEIKKDTAEDDAKTEQLKKDLKLFTDAQAHNAKKDGEVKTPKDDKSLANDKTAVVAKKDEKPVDTSSKELIEASMAKLTQKDTSQVAPKQNDKTTVVAKKDEKPLSLQDLLSTVDIAKPKSDEATNLTQNSNTKQESTKQDQNQNQNQMLQTPITADTNSVQNNLDQKIRDANATIRNFSEDLKEKIDEYKPPIMKVTMELKPDNMAPVDVTMITRGNNLIVNINSSDEALKMFMNNASDFRQNLMNIGFTEMTMNFNFKDQNGEKRQWQYQEQSSKKYKEISDITANSTVTGIEIVTPQYA